jgi:hypothetical protein
MAQLQSAYPPLVYSLPFVDLSPIDFVPDLTASGLSLDWTTLSACYSVQGQ